MIAGSLKFLPKSFLGIDIGTSSLKMVELSSWGSRRSFKNYAEIQAATLYQKPFRTFEKNTLLLSSKDIARALQGMVQEARITTRQAVFSIPDFSSFFTYFELPAMSKEELPEAVQYEARRHVPLPFSEITFDWQLIDGNLAKGSAPVKILLVAVPNEVINQYQEIARMAQLKLFALEAEVFGLMRAASVKEEKQTVALLDIGAQTTTINIVAKGILRNSHGLDIAGNSFTERIAQSLSTNASKAEEYKATRGLVYPDTLSILSPLVDMIILEIEKISQNFFEKEKKEVEKIILGGGSAQLPGLQEYFHNHLKKETEIINPFRHLFFPPILEASVKTMGPSYAVAIGMAQRGLE